jgi:hypothetical protein
VTDPESPPLLVGGRVLDAGAVVAWCRSWLHMEVLTRIAGQLGIALVVPAGALVEAGRRLGADAVEVVPFVELGPVVVADLDRHRALILATGAARCDTTGAEITAATRLHVIDLARRRDWSIITDDATPYPGMPIEPIPPP